MPDDVVQATEAAADATAAAAVAAQAATAELEELEEAEEAAHEAQQAAGEAAVSAIVAGQAAEAAIALATTEAASAEQDAAARIAGYETQLQDFAAWRAATDLRLAGMEQSLQSIQTSLLAMNPPATPTPSEPPRETPSEPPPINPETEAGGPRAATTSPENPAAAAAQDILRTRRFRKI